MLKYIYKTEKETVCVTARESNACERNLVKGRKVIINTVSTSPSRLYQDGLVLVIFRSRYRFDVMVIFDHWFGFNRLTHFDVTASERTLTL